MPRIDSGLPAFTSKIAKVPMHRGHSVEQTATICILSEHETSRALGDAVHQDPPAAGRRCTRSSISRCRSSAQACRASIARSLCSATAARRSVAIFPPCASIALQPFGRARSREGTSVHPAAGVFPLDHLAGNSIWLCPVLVVRTRDPRNTPASFTLQIESAIPTSNQASRKPLTAL